MEPNKWWLRRSPQAWGVAAAGMLVVLAFAAILRPSNSGEPTPTPMPTLVVTTAPPSPSSSSSIVESPSLSSLPTATAGGAVETPVPCTRFDPACVRMPISGAGAVPFTAEIPCGGLGACVLRADVYYPQSHEHSWPVIVAVPGGPLPPGSRSGLGAFAQLAAGLGAVVYAVDWREGPQFGGGWKNSHEDIACAIRFARATASDYGGDGGHVVLVAHSFGPFVASVVALSPDLFTPPPGQCLATAGSTKPDVFVGISGVYETTQLSPEFASSFFGGSSGDATPPANGTPYGVVATHAGPRIPVHLIHGTADANVTIDHSQAFLEALQAAGYDADLTVIQGGDHSSVLQDRATFAVVMSAAGAAP